MSKQNNLFTLLLTLSLLYQTTPSTAASTVCIVGSGIGGATVSHFLRLHATTTNTLPLTIQMFERNPLVGGRMATVTISGETFEAGASILHPKNYHAANFTKALNLKRKERKNDMSLGIWGGKDKGFVFETLRFGSGFKWIEGFVNDVYMFFRYGLSLIRMQRFVENTVNKFLKYYESVESRPTFETVDEMLQWAGLRDLTTRTLHEELVDVGLSPLLIQELVTVITRINYGQSCQISGLAGAVSLAGSGGGLWAIEGGNWQMAAGLINSSDVQLHLNEEIETITYLEDYYELNSTSGNSYSCDVAVVATPLDEVSIRFIREISIPERKLQHTHATFVRGLLNPEYFGLKSVSEIPDLVGTIEDPDLPFSSISILKRHGDADMTYKVFSRKALTDELLDSFFSVRKEIIPINWAAYPLYTAPEEFAPIILDGRRLYYVNAFENAASTMETSAVAAENVARLILSRLSEGNCLNLSNSRSTCPAEKDLLSDS